MFMKYRDVLNSDNQIITTLGIKWWWKWPKLMDWAHYGPTKLKG